MNRLFWALNCSIVGMVVMGCADSAPPDSPPVTPSQTARDTAEPALNPESQSEKERKPAAAARPEPIVLKNVIYTARPNDATAAPKLTAITLPTIENASAIWGSTGRDHTGRIYLGISCEPESRSSAHLVSLNPVDGKCTDLGSVTDQLKKQGKAPLDATQCKIHTKILQTADGYLYFASMDEFGEKEDGSVLPTYGSHLWRIAPGSRDWEHLGSTKEAIISMSLGGRFIYYLGYFGHVLYQLDTETSKITHTVRVGSVGGHITRNFIADDQGHVYVPRLQKQGQKSYVDLVEFNEELREVGRFPLEYYSTTPDSRSFGITAVTRLKSGSFVFVTDQGRLYRLDPRSTGAAVNDLGWLDPLGPSSIGSLFSYDGETMVHGVGRRLGKETLQWLSIDLKTRASFASKADFPLPPGARDLLMYGSMTRDDQGRCYLAGSYELKGKYHAGAWQLGN